MESLKVLFITTDEELNSQSIDRKQGDYHENVALIGLRKLLGENCVDFPRKRILYHDWSNVAKENLHGRGFSLYHEPIADIPDSARNLDQDFDVILYGTSFNYGMKDLPELEKRCKLKFYIDGNDLYGQAPNNKYLVYDGERVIGTQIEPCFKTQLLEASENVFPFGCGLPESRILPINLENKSEWLQNSYPYEAYFLNKESFRGHYKYSDEEEYYKNLASSWFGISCKRGGWDAMRNYEIIAAGSVLLYRDYDKKPALCSPGDMPAISYSSLEELRDIANRLVVNFDATDEYIDILNRQREWLINNGTTEARARYIIKVLKGFLK